MGEVTVRVGHEILDLTPGEEVVIPPNVVHGWSNLSSGMVRVRIRFRPGLAIEAYLRNTYGLHGDGRVNAAGKLPLLQLAGSKLSNASLPELDRAGPWLARGDEVASFRWTTA